MLPSARVILPRSYNSKRRLPFTKDTLLLGHLYSIIFIKIIFIVTYT